MPSYAWSCAACGAPNDAAADRCETCGCPALATVAQSEASREEHLARGGTVVPSRVAAGLHSELCATRVFGPVALLLMGVLPSDLRRLPSAVALLLMLGGALLLISLGALNWAWPRAGFEASSLLWAASLAGAVLCSVLALFLAIARGRRPKAP